MNREEKRWASRTPMWLKVSLYHNGNLTKFGLATNFSLGGLLILCKHNNLAIGQKLEIVFDHDFRGQEKHCHLPAEIKRITGEGIAVSFCQHDSNAFSCIQKMLKVSNREIIVAENAIPNNTDKHEAA